MKRSLIETIVFAVSALLIVIVAIGLLVDMGRPMSRTIKIKIDADRIEPASPGWDVMIRVKNEGRLTAEQLTVEGQVGDQVSSITFDYLPDGSVARGVLRFENDPNRNPPTFRVVSYRKP